MSEIKKIKIVLAADHAGFAHKERVKASLINFELQDFGTFSTESVDYPDFAHPVATAVENAEFDFGILFCGSGQGMAITANKHQNIRAALCWQMDIAILSRQHNNANILCIPARFVSEELAVEMANIFINTYRG